MDNREYIWLYRTKHFGRISNHWDRGFYGIEAVKKWVQEHIGESLEAFSTIEQLVFPIDSSKPLDAYRADKGESFFVCVRKKNNSTNWKQFSSPHSAKEYICSLSVVKEVHIFSSKDMAMRF